MMHVSAEDDPKGAGYLTGVLLLSRSHALPPSGLLDGKFDLLDLATGDTVPFQIIEISSAGDPTPNAAERLGGSSGSAVLGSGPQGLNRDLCFPAANVPACGYKVYRLVPQETPPQFRTRLNHAAASIENDFYRVEVDGETGCVASIYDRSAERELLDSDCPHGFGALVVRNPLRSGDCLMQNVQVRQGGSGPVCSWLEVTGSAYGHPAIKQTVTLYDGLREVHLAARILKDATPLLDVALAFPFLAAKPEFRYEANLAAMAPVNDYLPGSYWNRLTVQNWARVNDGDFSIVWSSRDAPVVSLGELWPDRMSPAHSCYTGHRIEGPPVPPDRLTNGWIYSNIANSNFRTNFSCTQAGDMLFRYAIASREGAMSDCEAALWGAQTASPLTAIFTEGPRDGALPVSAGFVEVEGDCILLACKRAEDGRGLILRLWNPEADIADAKVRLPWMRVSEVNLTNLVEEDRGVALKHDEGCFSVEVGGRGVATMRVIPQARA